MTGDAFSSFRCTFVQGLVFCSADEMAFIIAAGDRLIPADEFGPSATALHGPHYIDLQRES